MSMEYLASGDIMNDEKSDSSGESSTSDITEYNTEDGSPSV